MVFVDLHLAIKFYIMTFDRCKELHDKVIEQERRKNEIIKKNGTTKET